MTSKNCRRPGAPAVWILAAAAVAVLVAAYVLLGVIDGTPVLVAPR